MLSVTLLHQKHTLLHAAVAAGAVVAAVPWAVASAHASSCCPCLWIVETPRQQMDGVSGGARDGENEGEGGGVKKQQNSSKRREVEQEEEGVAFFSFSPPFSSSCFPFFDFAQPHTKQHHKKAFTASSEQHCKQSL